MRMVNAGCSRNLKDLNVLKERYGAPLLRVLIMLNKFLTAKQSAKSSMEI